MNKKAVSDYYSADEAAVLALRAGCDMILMPEDFEQAYNGVLEAVQSGVISEERINDSLRRIYRIKYADRVEE
jgi:beta-N-acetylhexosaminidase